MRLVRPLALIRLSYWLAGLALLSLAIFGAMTTRRVQAELELTEYAGIVSSTEQAMELWERRVLDAVDNLLRSLEQADEVAALEAASRGVNPYFDAYYLWNAHSGAMLHPKLTSAVDDRASSRCLARTDALHLVLPAPLLAREYLSCLPAPPYIEVLAIQHAAQLYLNVGRPDLAAMALQLGQTPPDLDLAAGIERGVRPMDMARLRMAQLEATTKNGSDWQDGLIALGREFMRLNGPDLAPLLENLIPDLAQQLDDLGAELERAELELIVERVRRRSEAWAEVRDRLSRREDIPTSRERPPLLRDPYVSPPYLMFYRRMPDPSLVGAVQVDEGILMERFLSVVEEKHRSLVTVKDGSGRWITGRRWSVKEPQQLTFPLVFDYLRLELPPPRHQKSPRTRNFLLIVQLAPIAMAALLGMLALAARTAATRRRLELEERRREFITRVTHELKTPLAGIRVMAEVLELGAYRDDEEHAELAQRILAESERLSRRVDEVLRTSRDPGDIRLEKVDPVELCEDLARRWKDLMEQSGIVLELSLEPVPPFLAERVMLRDALAALLENALKYRHGGRESRVQLKLRQRGRRWVVFEVLDNGLGVPPSKRKAIFERFVRVEGPGRGTAGGHGLGLSFVANAARVHRGRVECRSGLEGGARFVMRIPR